MEVVVLVRLALEVVLEIAALPRVGAVPATSGVALDVSPCLVLVVELKS
jgi:hypothetical protein